MTTKNERLAMETKVLLEKEFNCGVCEKSKVCKYAESNEDLLDQVETKIENSYVPDCIHFSVRCDYYKQYFVIK